MKPIILTIEPGHSARYVKIVQKNPAWLPFNQVEIYVYE